VGDCTSCGLCLAVCPVLNDAPRFEARKILLARPKHPPPKFKTCGAVTSILISLLDAEAVDGALVSKMDVEAKPISYFATTRHEITSAGGANYFSFGHLYPLRSPLKQGKRVATVGVGCSIEGVRHVASRSRRLSQLMRYNIGLFCSAQLDREITLQALQGRGITPNQLRSINIKKGFARVASLNGRELAIRLSDLGPAKRRGCAFCLNLANSAADISVGEMGAPDGFTILVVRNATGQEVLDIASEGLEMKEAPHDILSEMERTLAKKAASLVKFRPVRTRPRQGSRT